LSATRDARRFDVSPAEAIALQKRLRRLVSRRRRGGDPALVAGADVHFPARDRALAAIAVLAFPGLEPVETVTREAPCTLPYIPGLLSFREIPAILAAWEDLSSRPDLVICDGHGIAHPRGFGLASHLGLALDLPAVGCAKSPLCGRWEEPGADRGDRSRVLDAAGQTIGYCLRTRAGVRPVWVSVGHMIDLRAAARIVLACAPLFRLPEPSRAAHRLAGGR